MAKASAARIKANQRWDARAYDKALLRLPKGALEQLKAAASEEGESLNRYILIALERRSGLKLTLDGELPGPGPRGPRKDYRTAAKKTGDGES